MERKRANKVLYIVLITLLLAVTALIGGWGYSPAFADTFDNSNVLKDLQQDSEFNAEDFPYIENDYSVQVIQLAESDTKHLYVYTYQPCQLSRYLVAKHINMALTENVDDTELYDLILVNTNGVFAKYLVKGVTVSNSASRAYNVTSIYRAWDKEIDGGTDNNNTVDEKAYAVRRLFRARTDNGKIIYSSDPTYTVQIINPYVDYLIYITSSVNGFPSIKFSTSSMTMFDGHYVAFSTDWDIDKLKSATVSYAYKSAKGYMKELWGFELDGGLEYGAEQRALAYPTYLEKAEIDGAGWYGKSYHYEWDRIQTVAQFIATEDRLTDETKDNLAGKQWVLRFLETEHAQREVDVLGYSKIEANFTVVDQVTILRLEFEVDGVTYNLGAVSDMQSGDLYPGNTEKADSKKFWEWLANLLGLDVSTVKWLFWGFVVLVVLAIALPVLGAIFPVFGQILLSIVKAIGKALIWLLKGLWWLICLPFRAIKAIAEKVKNKKSTSKKKKTKSKGKAKTKTTKKKKGGKK